MLQVKAVSGQSIFDLCLQTYSTFDLLSKFIQDNKISDINQVPLSGQSYVWDETLSENQNVNLISQNSNVILATSVLPNGSVLSVIKGQSENTAIGNQSVYYQPVNSANITKYEKTLETQYIAGGGETFIILPELIGASIVQISREIQPQRDAYISFNANNGKITFNNDPLVTTETIFIIYTLMQNS